jgi:hypothetical protein
VALGILFGISIWQVGISEQSKMLHALHRSTHNSKGALICMDCCQKKNMDRIPTAIHRHDVKRTNSKKKEKELK